MKMCWSGAIDPILAVGQPLMDLGINNWALEADQALAAIQELGSQGIAVLGGDVFIKGEADLRPAPDRWWCDRNSQESHADFARRSCQAAAEYIAKYHWKNLGETPLFALVPRADGR